MTIPFNQSSKLMESGIQWEEEFIINQGKQQLMKNVILGLLNFPPSLREIFLVHLQLSENFTLES